MFRIACKPLIKVFGHADMNDGRHISYMTIYHGFLLMYSKMLQALKPASMCPSHSFIM